MAITTERYVPDSGRVQIDSTDYSGSVKTVSVSAPRRQKSNINSLGGSATRVQDQDKAGDFEITLTIYDDFNKAASATALHKELYDAYIGNTQLTSMTIAPAGSTVGMQEWTLTAAEVVECPPFGDLDADTDEDATIQAVISCTGLSGAAIV